MASHGALTKIVFNDTRCERDDVEVITTDELGDPLHGVDEETAEVDELLVEYDSGNGVSCETQSMSPCDDDPLIIDIDDGQPSRRANRLGILRRVDTGGSAMRKFDRHSGEWK